MNTGKLNSEGYPDPTAYDALKAVELERKMKPRQPLIFICSPLAGNIERNRENARTYCRFAMKQGVIPFAPHLLFTQFLDERAEEERILGMSYGLAVLDRCDGLWAFGGLVSRGMRAEIDRAKRRRLLVRYFNNRCAEVAPFA